MKQQLIMEELITKYFCYWNILIIDYLMIILILINMKKKKFTCTLTGIHQRCK